MKKVLLSGCHGQMGHVLQRLIADNPTFEIVAGIDRTAKKMTISRSILQSMT